MSRQSREPVPEQRSGEIAYATPARRQVVGRSAIAALILGLISLGALLWGLCGPLAAPNARVALLIMSAVASIIAIPVATVALRKASKENGAGRKQARLGLLLAGITIALGLTGFALTNALNRSYARLYQTKCQWKVKNIGQALVRYANDNNGQFPQGFAQLIAGDYVSPHELVCDGTNDRPAAGPTTQQTLVDFARPGRCSYIYLGAGASASSRSRNIVLAYEPLGNHEDEGAHFIFGDGNVRWLEAMDAQKLIEQLKAGINLPKQ